MLKMQFPCRAAFVAAGLLCGLSTAWCRAEVKLPAVFSDHMVLQRDASLPVWGWATAGEKVTVTIAGQSQATVTDPAGKWSVKLDKLQTGEPTTMTVAGTNSITIKDVLVGDVWLCSGQSNMQLPVGRADNFDKEKPAADYPKLRMFNEASAAADAPQETGKGQWIICSPDTVAGFSAVAYFFGREIHKTLGVPVGLVKSAVGGTVIEAWTSLPAQKDLPELKPLFDRWDKKQTDWDPTKAQATFDKQLAAYKENAVKAKAAGKPAPTAPRKPVEPRIDQNHPAVLYNGKISPLIPYAIKGAIWYQGESNGGSETAKLYGLQLKTLITDWRTRWAQGDFPFAYVQLPNLAKHEFWPYVREGMLKDLALPHTGMAVTIDVGDPANVHPTNKQDPGHRLALWALGEVYGQKVATTSGPLPAGSKVDGGTIVCTFAHADGGLVAKGGGELKGFQIAGEDKRWVSASGKIVGETVVVASPEVKAPVAVRYAWAGNPDCNLTNGQGIPASPFRTDEWP